MSPETLVRPKHVQSRVAEAHTRLQHSVPFVPLDSRGRLPVVLLSEELPLWDGQPRKLATPTTINGALTEALIHQKMMELEGEMRDPAYPIQGSVGINKRTALLHVFLPTDEERAKIDDTDPDVIARREALVPPTIDIVDLYDNILRELKPQTDKRTGKKVATAHPISYKEAEAKLEEREARGENPLSARFETVLDILVAEWAAREGKVDTATEIGVADFSKSKQGEEIQPLPNEGAEFDLPRGADGRPIPGHVVYVALASDGVTSGQDLGNLAGRVLDVHGEVRDGLEGADAEFAEVLTAFRERAHRAGVISKQKETDGETARRLRKLEEEAAPLRAALAATAKMAEAA